jgi:hypothetical protein
MLIPVQNGTNIPMAAGPLGFSPLPHRRQCIEGQQYSQLDQNTESGRASIIVGVRVPGIVIVVILGLSKYRRSTTMATINNQLPERVET